MILFTKAHVSAYTKQDGTFVAEHDDARSRHAKYADLFKQSLGRKREDMPQIPNDIKPQFLGELRAAGVSVDAGETDPGTLKPTQGDFNPENMDYLTSEARAGRYDKANPVLVSSDGRVLDGHHRWAVATLEGLGLPTVKIGMPMKKLLDVAEEFNQRHGIERRGLKGLDVRAAAPTLVKGQDFGRLSLFTKAHVSSYTKKDGTFVAEHDDKRAAAKRDQTETPEFKRWFDGSKVIGADKKPLVVYRGSPWDWRDRSAITGPLSFALSAQVASVYAAKQDGWGGASFVPGSQMHAVYLSIKNPLKISTVGVNFGKLMRKLGGPATALAIAGRVIDRYVKRRGPSFLMKLSGGFDTYRQWVQFVDMDLEAGKPEKAWDKLECLHLDAYALVDDEEFVKLLESHGYDGVIHKDVFQGGARHIKKLSGREVDDGILSARREHLTYRPFRPEQIKSATGNNGNFDPQHPDMTKAHVGPYMRGGKLVNLSGYDGRQAHAQAAPGQLTLFPAPERKPMPPSPFKGKDPVLDTPDLFSGKTRREEGVGQSNPEVKESEKLSREPEGNGAEFGDLYHGAPVPFDKFDPGKRSSSGAGYDHQGRGFYLTSDPHGYGRFFAREGGAKLALRLMVDGKKEESNKISDGYGHVMTVKLKPSAKVLRMEDAPAYVKQLFDRSVGNKEVAEELRSTVRKLGYHALNFEEPNFPEGWRTKNGARTTVVYDTDKTDITGHREADKLDLHDDHPYWSDKSGPDLDGKHPLQRVHSRLAEVRREYADAHNKGDEEGKGFYRHVMSGVRDEHKKYGEAFRAYHQTGDGTELSTKDGKRHAMLLPDASNPGKYRYQMFDERGFSSHSTHDTPEEAVADAASQGFHVHNPGILDKLAGTDEWAHGMAVNAVMQAHNSGQIDWSTAMGKIKNLQAERDAKREKPADGRVHLRSDLADGTMVRDSKGKTYRVHYQRNGLVLAHPVVGGKPQVSADTTVRFWVDPERSPSGENDRTDPIYPAETPLTKAWDWFGTEPAHQRQQSIFIVRG